MDRRAVFFLVAAGACALMAVVGLAKYRNIAVGTAVVYVVFALASFLDFRSRSR